MPSRELSQSRKAVREYLDDQLHGEEITHLERVAVEHVGGIRYEICDAHTRSAAQWWVVTNPTNLYTPQDFKSRDVVLTFHIGLAMRVAHRYSVPIAPSAEEILSGPWRRWEQAAEALEQAEEAEHLQAVGSHLREAMISFAHDVADDRLVPAGTARPKASAVVDWLNLLVNYFAPGEHDARLRGYLKALVQPTWEYVQHLLHDKHATRMDAEIGLAAVAHLRGRSSKLGLRPHQVVNSRCARVLHVGSALRVMTCPR